MEDPPGIDLKKDGARTCESNFNTLHMLYCDILCIVFFFSMSERLAIGSLQPVMFLLTLIR